MRFLRDNDYTDTAAQGIWHHNGSKKFLFNVGLSQSADQYWRFLDHPYLPVNPGAISCP